MKRCRCRNCGEIYQEDKSTADWKGFCTQACVHEKARKHGYKKSREKYGSNEYTILSNAKMIGSVYVDAEGCVV